MKKTIDLILEIIASYALVVTNWSWHGECSRRSYFLFLIGNSCVAIYLMLFDKITGLYSPYWGVGPIYGIYIVLVFWPGWCAAARRLRDAGYSVHRLWWVLVPVVNIIIFWWLLKPTKTRVTRYPKNMFIAEEEQRLARQQ